MAIPSPYPTADDIVTSVSRSAALPLSQNTLTASDLLAFLTEEMQSTISDLVHTIREEYWVKNYDIAITSQEFQFDIPQRALAGGLRDVVFVDQSGNEIEIAQLAPEQIKSPAYFAYQPAFQQQGYFVKDSKINLWPQTANNTAYTLRLKYERRPGTLVSIDDCAQITSVDSNNSQVTVASLPSDWTTSTTVDIIQNVPAFVSVSDDQVISAINVTTLTLSPFPTGLAVGQWICPAGTSCIAQIPLETYPLLVSLGVKRVHQSMQNSNGFNIAVKDSQDKLIMAREMMTPRVEGQPRKLVNKNTWWGPWGYPFFR